MNEELLQPLRAQIAAAGLQNYQTALVEAARIAVDIELDGAAQNIIGESRLGGAPDVPANWQWPADKDGEKLALDLSTQTNWHNLLRLDSIMELGFLIWDAGYLNFLIHRDDLSKLDFSRVYAAVESS